MGERFGGLPRQKGVSCTPTRRRVLLPEGKRFIRELGGRLRGKGMIEGEHWEDGGKRAGWAVVGTRSIRARPSAPESKGRSSRQQRLGSGLHLSWLFFFPGPGTGSSAAP